MSRRFHQRNESLIRARKAQRMFREKVTAIEAAKALGVSRMTLYRDLERLRQTGEPWIDPSTVKTAAPASAAPELDPLLDGWEPQTVERVTDSDLEDLLA